MTYERIDHVILPVTSLDEAGAAFERLGLTLTPPTHHRGRGTVNRAFFVGEGAAEFYVELIAIADREEARRVRGPAFLDAFAPPRGLSAVALAVDDLPATLAMLADRGPATTVERVYADDGRLICDVAVLDVGTEALVDLRLVQYPEESAQRQARHAAAGLFAHRFLLGRLDHLAVVAPEAAVLDYWPRVLGIPITGEVRTPQMVIHQLQIGGAILELIDGASPDSPIRARPPGLISMAAFEVDDLDAAVAMARAAGFTPSEPATGVLPGTRTATIAAGELAGLAMQLLQYV